MAARAAAIELTPAEVHQLTAWVRAGTTPQRLARRARLILGSAAGRGSRALAQHEHLSRTTVRRWLARFGAKRCDGLPDRPLSRYSLADLTTQVAAVLGSDAGPSRSSIWRLLAADALRPWRYRCWLFPRDPHFLERAGPVLDLYACWWQGQPLWSDEYVLSADEKTSIQARHRRHPTLPPGPQQAARVEHEDQRGGAVQYLAAWDVHRAVVLGRCEPRTGRAAFGRLVDQVMSQKPYRSARRVFWIVDNGSSHRGERAAADLRARHPRGVVVHTPVPASWLNQVEIYFSILQRKVLTPNDNASLPELIEPIAAFGDRYSARGKPFAWRFSRQDLERRLRHPLLRLEPMTCLRQAA